MLPYCKIEGYPVRGSYFWGVLNEYYQKVGV